VSGHDWCKTYGDDYANSADLTANKACCGCKQGSNIGGIYVSTITDPNIPFVNAPLHNSSNATLDDKQRCIKVKLDAGKTPNNIDYTDTDKVCFKHLKNLGTKADMTLTGEMEAMSTNSAGSMMHWDYVTVKCGANQKKLGTGLSGAAHTQAVQTQLTTFIKAHCQGEDDTMCLSLKTDESGQASGISICTPKD
jgi:hypothetical protein